MSGDNGNSWGCFQTQYKTYELWSQKHLGYIAPRTYINQKYLITLQVQEWIDKGYSDRAIALLYNHPASRGVKCGRGYNAKQKVTWDSCAYAENLLANL